MTALLKKVDVEIHESLDVYNDPPTPTVDIVAVPGLGAHAVKSWQWNKPSSSFNWITAKKDGDSAPKDTKDIGGLAKDFPTARVLLFNYASAYQGAYQVEQYMTNIVGTFLRQLKAKREDNSRRPLVFLGHSMGGLVIAKTLVTAEGRRDEYPDMYEAISGCLFFGTPFNGAPVADIAKEWGTINERLGKAIDSQLITLLQPGNETLKELRDEFVRSVNKLGQKVRVHCFWERRKTHWEDLIAKLASQEFPASSLGKLELDEYRQFVSRESATFPGMDMTGLARTHRDLVRFESDKDSAYQLVKVPLREIVKAAPRTARARFNEARRLAVDPKTYRSILDVLDGADPKSKLKFVQHKLTSESWIVRDRESLYVDWLENTTRPDEYLWIHGPEGKGKSIAAATIIGAIDERIRKLDDTDQAPHLMAYFFCEATPDHCTAEDIVKSLMRQLCQQHEVLATYATRFLNEKLDDRSRPKASLSIENLWQSLEEMLSESTVSTIYIVLNNLHELYQSPSTAKLFAFIQRNTERISPDNVSRVNKARTKWLITSRSHKVMRHMFSSPAVQEINLDDPKYGDQQQQALQKYAWTKAEDLRKTKNYTMAMTYLTGSVIGNRADNTKWIDVAVVQLAAFPIESSEFKAQRMLETLPQDFKSLLDAAWLSILKRDDEDMETIRELLRALVLTYEDPRTEELLVLAGLSMHSKECNAELQKLINKCQPLVITRSTGGDVRIGFVNADVKKHLLKHSKELLNIGDEWTKWQHGKMSLRCFAHIMDAFPPDIECMKTQDPEASRRNEEDQSEDKIPERSGLVPAQDGSSDESKMSEEEDDAGDESAAPTATKVPEFRLALDYATRYWLRHAGDATVDVAEIISRERLFWAPDSAQRQVWIKEYQDLTNALAGFGKFTMWTALHVSASLGFPRLVTALLKEGYQEEIHEYDSFRNTPLHLAAFYGHVETVEELLNAGSTVEDMGPTGDAASPLAMAALNGQIEVMRKLMISWNANVDAVDHQYGPVLNSAIISGNTDAVNLLLERDVRVNYGMNEVEVAPLAMSAFYSDMEMFSTILDKTGSNLTPEEFDKAMIWASAAGNLDILRKLLSFDHEHGAFQVSLFNASENQNWESCLLILRHPPAQGLDCDDVLKRAATGSETLDEVIQACWDNNENGISQVVLDECLYQATDREKRSTVELLLKFGANANATGVEFGNALTASANDGTEEILSLLLDAGASVNSADGFALQQASSQGHLHIVRMLLSHGADVNELSKHPSCTALQAACDSGHYEVTGLLLQSGANPNLGGDGTRPIFGAILDGGKVLDELLKSTELNLDVVSGPYKGTPLATAAFCLPADRMGQLIDHGATIDFLDEDGDTALTAAVQVGDANCLRLLLERGADFLHVSKRNKTALQDAIESENDECIKLLLARTDFLLRDLQNAAQGDQQAQKIIESEKKARKEAMAKEAAEAKARECALGADSPSDESDQLSEGNDTESTTKASNQGTKEDLGLNTNRAEEVSLAEDSVKNALGHASTGYPTPKSVVEAGGAEEDETAEIDLGNAAEHEIQDHKSMHDDDEDEDGGDHQNQENVEIEDEDGDDDKTEARAADDDNDGEGQGEQ